MLRCMTKLNVVCTTESAFDRTTAVTPIEGQTGEFAVDLDAGWSSLVGVHGGYLCAIAVRGAEAMVEDRVVRTLTTSFLRTAQVGPATLSVRAVREGRSITTMVADLAQDGRLLTTTRLTMLTARSGVEWAAPNPIELPPVDACVRVDAGRVAHFQQADGVLDPGAMPFSNGDRATVRGYLRPLEVRPVDRAWLAMATDWFPPPAFVRLEPPTGGVSIDLTTHIHQPRVALGEDDWLTGAFEIETSTGGLAVEHGRIARRDGTLVAESFQTRLTAQG
jgi:acyl-CoA thioesterase